MSRYIRRDDGKSLFIDRQTDVNLHNNGISDGLLRIAIKVLKFDQVSLRATVNFPKEIGLSHVIEHVEVSSKQTTTFAFRIRRPFPSPFDPTANPQPTTKLGIVAEQLEADDNTWLLRTAYFGPYAPPEPTDFLAIARTKLRLASALNFWCKHSFTKHASFRDDRMPIQTSWNRLIREAVRKVNGDILEEIGYFEVVKTLAD